MAFNRVADPLLNADKPGRSTDWKQMRDNQDDHETRIEALEGATDIRVGSHFSGIGGHSTAAGANDGIIVTANTTVNDYKWFEGKFYVYARPSGAVNTFIYNQIALSATVNDHLLRFDQSAQGATAHAGIICAPVFNMTYSDLPLTYTARIKRSDRSLSFVAGFSGAFDVTGAWAVPSNGIYLRRGSAANKYRFTVSDGGANTDGADFPDIANGTWFEVEIVVTSSTLIECSIDGNLIETFTTGNIPITKNIAGVVDFSGSSTDRLDRIEVAAAGPLTDSA